MPACGDPVQDESDGGLTRFLVPLDGSRLAEVVLPVAASLAARLRANLTLLTVMERGAPATVHGQRHITGTAEAEAYLREVARRCAAPGVAIEWHVHPNEEGDVAKSIIDHAADLKADLTILCTHGGGGARRVFFGSVAQQVLRGGTRPVLLIRPLEDQPPDGVAGWDLHRLLVPLDGSRPSEAALPVARTLARAYGADVFLLRVVPTLATITGERASTARLVPTATAASLDLEEREAKVLLETIATQLRAEGARASVLIRRGEPAQEVLAVALRVNAELIVMATHGRAGLDAVFSGSVAPRVLARFPRALLLVRAGRDGAPGGR